MNNKIKQKIKNVVGNQKITKKGFCKVCEKETEMTINFKEDKVICTHCKSKYEIDNDSYQMIYRELNKMGIF